MNGNKTCVVCNKQYKFCAGCPSKYNVTETWRNLFCSENCREIYKVYDQIKAGKIKDTEARKQLIKLDMSYLDKINNPIKPVLSLALDNSKESEVGEEKQKNTSLGKRGRKKKNDEVD